MYETRSQVFENICTSYFRYFYSPVDGTPYSLAVVLPDGYGMYELQAEQEVKHSTVNGLYLNQCYIDLQADVPELNYLIFFLYNFVQQS